MKPDENLPISTDAITIYGARQNNLKNLSLALPLNELIVVTGVSGSGKSSLVFDTLYAEGQRRYVETFSPYARQFLDRMDKPQVDAIHGIPPAIAIDQTNQVRTSRSTVGTMTELNDHLKLLFARTAQLFCRGCGRMVHRDTPDSIYAGLVARAQAAGDPRLIVTFPVTVPKNFTDSEVKKLLEAQGYTRIHRQENAVIEMVQDRLRISSAERVRVIEGLEAALRVGQGRVNVYPFGNNEETLAPWKFSSDLHCADCDIHYGEPTPSLFSFNSPLGACDSCRGLDDKLTPLESRDVAVCIVDAEHFGALHRRYELAAIPTTVVADHEGVVCRAFVGAFTATDLWAAVAELRDPGSTPEPDLGAL